MIDRIRFFVGVLSGITQHSAVQMLLTGQLDVHTVLVHTTNMKNITLSADEGLLQQARRRASAEHRTLNDVFRQWLDQYVSQSTASDTYDDVMKRLNHVSAGRKFSREQMHDRR